MPSKSDRDEGAEQARAAQSQPAPAAAEPAPDEPGKLMEPAAPAGAEAQIPPGLSPPGQGAQVILTGDAQAAARGGIHGDIGLNTQARDQAIAAGHVVEGTTAVAAADATTIAGTDEIDEAEAAAVAKAHADAQAARIARAAKKPA